MFKVIMKNNNKEKTVNNYAEALAICKTEVKGSLRVECMVGREITNYGFNGAYIFDHDEFISYYAPNGCIIEKDEYIKQIISCDLADVIKPNKIESELIKKHYNVVL